MNNSKFLNLSLSLNNTSFPLNHSCKHFSDSLDQLCQIQNLDTLEWIEELCKPRLLFSHKKKAISTPLSPNERARRTRSDFYAPNFDHYQITQENSFTNVTQNKSSQTDTFSSQTDREQEIKSTMDKSVQTEIDFNQMVEFSQNSRPGITINHNYRFVAMEIFE